MPWWLATIMGCLVISATMAYCTFFIVKVIKIAAMYIKRGQ